MPQADHECGTCHNACDCREARFKRMEELLREVLAWGLAEPHDPALDANVMDLRRRIEGELSQ